jgi:chromosomal replication initiator protein
VDNLRAQDALPSDVLLEGRHAMETIWRRAQPILRERVGERNYKTWIEPMQETQSGGQLQLEVPNQFVLEWVTRNFLMAIDEVVASVAGNRLDVRIVVSDGAGDVPVAKGPLRAGEATRARKPVIGRLVAQYTFSSFVVGESNQMAHDAALEVAHRPARRFNPLFIHGGVGLGKTHLINALAHEFLARHPRRRLACLAAETFMNHLINSLRQDQMSSFRDRYRQLDLLVLDDAQFIAGKERTQEEFFHTFNALQEDSKQIVLTSDKAPAEIAGLEQRLRSRFAGGLIADIHPPTLAMRVAIAQRKAAGMGFDLPAEVASLVARRSGTSVRELEGALARLIAYTNLRREKITLETAQEALAGLPERRVVVSFDDVVQRVAAEFGVAAAELVAHGLVRHLTLPRQVAMYLCRTVAGGSFPAIGEKFGGRDHSTVMHAVRVVEGKREADPATASLIVRLESDLRGGLAHDIPRPASTTKAKQTLG